MTEGGTPFKRAKGFKRRMYEMPLGAYCSLNSVHELHLKRLCD